MDTSPVHCNEGKHLIFCHKRSDVLKTGLKNAMKKCYELEELGRNYITEDYQMILKTLDFCICKMGKYLRAFIL